MAKHFVAIVHYTNKTIYDKTDPFKIVGFTQEPRVQMFRHTHLPKDVSDAAKGYLPGFFTDHTSQAVSTDLLVYWLRSNGLMQFNLNVLDNIPNVHDIIGRGGVTFTSTDDTNTVSFSQDVNVELEAKFAHQLVGSITNGKEPLYIHALFPTNVHIKSVKNLFDPGLNQAEATVIYNGALEKDKASTLLNHQLEAMLYDYLNNVLPQDNAWLKRKENQ